MSEKNKINKKEVIKGFIFSLVILLPITIYGFISGSSYGTIWPAVIITTLGFAAIWFIIRMGAFSTSSHGTRRVGNSLRDRKRNKLGAYNPEKNKKTKSVNELIKDNKTKSKQGIYIMVLIAVIELFATLHTYI